MLFGSQYISRFGYHLMWQDVSSCHVAPNVDDIKIKTLKKLELLSLISAFPRSAGENPLYLILSPPKSHCCATLKLASPHSLPSRDNHNVCQPRSQYPCGLSIYHSPPKILFFQCHHTLELVVALSLSISSRPSRPQING